MLQVRPSSTMVQKLIREGKVSEPEIRTLLKSLEHDGKLESWIDDDEREWFAPVPKARQETDPYSAIPCGVCPVRTSLLA